MQDKKQLDCIVVGAGISGLSAATLLNKHGANVVVLEARDRVGGRTWTRETNGATVDCGGAYVGPTQNRIMRVAKELGVLTHRIYVKGKSVLHVNGKRTAYTGTIPALGPLALLDLNHILVQTQKMCETVPLARPWTAKQAAEWDNMTLQDAMDANLFTSEARAIIRGACEAILAVEPAEVSYLYWLWYVQSGEGIQRLTDTDTGAQERKFVGGSQQISVKLAHRLGDRVKLQQVVRSVAWPGQGKEGPVTVRCESGEEYTARHLILALAPTLIPRMRFSPTLPGLKHQLCQRMPMGSIIKTQMHYSEAFWRKAGLAGTLFTDEGPVTYTYDDCDPLMNSDCPAEARQQAAAKEKEHKEKDGKTSSNTSSSSKAKIMGFCIASQARRWALASEEERKQAICAQYARQFGDERFLRPSGYTEQNWMNEEFSGGCYVGVLPPKVLTDIGVSLRQPLGQAVHFAGTECATRWSGYMDGAVQSGEKAAHDVLTLLVQKKVSGIRQPAPFQEEEPAPEDGSASDAYYAFARGPRPFGVAERLLPGPRGLLLLLAFFLLAALCIVAQVYATELDAACRRLGAALFMGPNRFKP